MRNLRGVAARRRAGLGQCRRRDDRCACAARPGCRRHRHARQHRIRPPPAQDHRPFRKRRAADGGFRSRPDHRLQRLHLQLSGTAEGTGGARLQLLLARRYGSHPQGLARLGTGLRDPVQRHVRLRPPRARFGARRHGARPFRHQAALYLAEGPRHPFRLVAAGAAGGGRGRHLDRPRRLQSLHDLSRRRAAAAHDLERSEEAAAGDASHHRGRRVAARRSLLEPVVRPGPGRERADGRGMARPGARCAEPSRGPPHGRRRAGRRAPVGRRRFRR